LILWDESLKNSIVQSPIAGPFRLLGHVRRFFIDRTGIS
jgi:hypothetical protein